MALHLLKVAIAWCIVLSPLASVVIAVRALRTGRRVKGELFAAILLAMFGCVLWMFFSTAYALRTGHHWVALLPWLVAVFVVVSSAVMAKVTSIEWIILLGVLFMLKVLPYEEKVRPGRAPKVVAPSSIAAPAQP